MATSILHHSVGEMPFLTLADSYGEACCSCVPHDDRDSYPSTPCSPQLPPAPVAQLHACMHATLWNQEEAWPPARMQHSV